MNTNENVDTVMDDFPTGKIRYTMRNDYMFKAVLQKNRKAPGTEKFRGQPN